MIPDHPIDTEALRRLADAAITPAPWVARTQECGGSRVYGAHGFPLPGCSNCGENDDAVYESGDGEFIAAARTAVPALLDALAAAEHRATRAEAQSAIRGRAVVIYRERAREAETRIKAVQDLIDQADTAGDWAVTCSRLQWAIDGTTPNNRQETA